MSRATRAFEAGRRARKLDALKYVRAVIPTRISYNNDRISMTSNIHRVDSGAMVQRGMHRCLRIAEIQVHIFGYLSPPACDILSRTCTTFYDQAMNVVWAKVSTFVPFMRCIPSESLVTRTTDTGPDDLFLCTHKLDFSREPQPEDWRHFSKHAHRVRVFDDALRYIPLDTCHYGCASDDCTSQLTSAAMAKVSHFLCKNAEQDRCFFPKLKNLHIGSVVAECWVPKYLPYLSLNTLQYLTFDHKLGHMPKNMDSDRYIGWVEAMPLMRSAWPHLRAIKLDAPISVSDSEGQKIEPYSLVLGPWFRSLSCLRSIQGSIAPHPSLVSALSELPLLKKIKLDESYLPKYHHTTLDTIPPLLSLSCFVSLRKFTIHNGTSHLDTIVSLLQGLGRSKSTKLYNINLRLRNIPSTPHSAAQFLSLLEAISQISRVRFLRICTYTERLDPDSSAQTELVLSGKLLSMLFPLRRMRCLELVGNLKVTIEDRDLFKASAAWPKLREIHLPISSECQSNTPSRPRITLVGVKALYEGCPRLQNMHMEIDCILPTVDNFDRKVPDIPLACNKNRKVPLYTLLLNFVPSDAPGESCYRDLDSAQCIAIAIRLMLPMVSYVILHCPLDREWEHHMNSLWSLYRVMEQTKVSALWSRLSSEGNSMGDHYEY